MIKPRVTLICPSFNQAAYIERTLDSVLSQNYPNLEFMVFDGGSTDGSVEIIERHSRHLSYWESCKDRGQSHAINKGLNRSTGEIENWINSDDELEKDSLETVASAFRDNPGAGIFVGQRLAIDEESRPMEFNYYKPKHLYYDMLAFSLYPPQESTFWRSSLRRRVGYLREDLHYSMDFDWYLRLAYYGKAWVIPRIIGRFRMVPGQKSGFRDDKGESLSRIRSEFLDTMRLSSQLTDLRIRLYRRIHRFLGRKNPYWWTPCSAGFTMES